MRKYAALLLILATPLTSFSKPLTEVSTEERLRKCDIAYVSCKNLVKEQDEVINEQVEVITAQEQELELIKAQQSKWYNSPIFWGIVGGVLGVAGGVAIGVSK